ncbi:YybH family protein [Bradyrhizobium sp. SYSU BS000235]|uniref:YybH family protein n=1 Tax=Bradyrhizobium sp. SYSU BS000235 TaxID=3411332 RepID=UPI003C784E96
MNSFQANYDAIGVIVDWLDACRAADLKTLLALYDQEATLECNCDGRSYRGATEIEAYWRPKLSGKVAEGFLLEDIHPVSDGLDVRYLGFEGKPLHITFKFNEGGKIMNSVCGPLCGSPRVSEVPNKNE